MSVLRRDLRVCVCLCAVPAQVAKLPGCRQHCPLGRIWPETLQDSTSAMTEPTQERGLQGKTDGWGAGGTMHRGQPPSTLPSALYGCLPLVLPSPQQNRRTLDQGREAEVTSRCKAGPGNLISQEVAVTGLPWALRWSIPAPSLGRRARPPAGLRMGVSGLFCEHRV